MLCSIIDHSLYMDYNVIFFMSADLENASLTVIDISRKAGMHKDTSRM